MTHAPRAIVLAPRAEKELAKLPVRVQQQIMRGLERFANTGHGDVRKLIDVDPPAYRLRVGDWRVRFATAPGVIEVERIANRRDAY